jgi:hypothetical protein
MMNHPKFDHVVVARYPKHQVTAAAVRDLTSNGVSIRHVSLIGHLEAYDGIQGFYRPADSSKSYEDAEGFYCRHCVTSEGQESIIEREQRAWADGIFGLMLGAMGFFVLPNIGSIVVVGPLAGVVTESIRHTGAECLIHGLMAVGIPNEGAIHYQTCLQSREFLLVVQGTGHELEQAEEILCANKSSPVSVKKHTIGYGHPIE